MATEAQSSQDLKSELTKKQREAELKAQETKNAEINKTRTGVGTRLHAGMTRGKGTMVISWEAFDDAQPETHPKSIQQFMEVTEKKDEATLVKYLITGFNDENYTAASDPLAEYVDYSWPAEAQTQFRLVVRNYARGAMVPIEDAVNLIKPGFVAQFSKKDSPESNPEPATV